MSLAIASVEALAGGAVAAAVIQVIANRRLARATAGKTNAEDEHIRVDTSTAVIQQLVGQGLAARLSARLGEGVLNGLMTARFGLAALSVCRPLPFVEAQPPTLADVASGLLSSRETPAQG
jgi:hypothetical protein